MKRILLLLALACGLTACSDNGRVRRTEDFNFDWRFTLGDDEAYSEAAFDDSSWRELRLPHDWAIEGEFSEKNPATPAGGALPGGIGWYRKHFVTPDVGGKLVNVEFDGVFMNSTVWVNGHEVGYRPYGYMSFTYDLTPYLRPAGEENVLAVKCDNALQPNSRWYSGCGIYRNVRLVVTDPLHVAYSGTYITTPEVSDDEATVRIETTVESAQAAEFTLRQTILDADSRRVASVESAPIRIADGERNATEVQTLAVKRPSRWSVESPYRYRMLTEVVVDGRVVDDYLTPFGIRTFEFSAEKGFFLNGKPVKILGVCQHHDMGALGSAVHRRALERQLQILKSFGCNGIRMSHNPPAPELLDLCDSMGFIVMDEALDMWRKRKTTYDYSLYFDEWHERDVTDFMKRDRNHPSIFMWSLGNEILEQWNSDDDSGELAAEQANLLMNFRSNLPQEVSDEMNPNVLMTIRLAELVRSIDPTRPITAGCNEPAPHNNLLRAEGGLDMVGYNYHESYYDSVPRWFPGRPFIGSETASSIQSRGFYLHPSTEERVQPKEWWITYDTPHHQCSAYDHSRAPWGALHETAWIAVRDRDFCSGTYIWTGFDYLGEPTPYSWPSRSSYFGIVDLCGFPKDIYYMYRAEWTDQPTLHLFPHWNWTPGEKIDMWAYYNNADEVELLVNGVSQGRRSKSADRLHCIWEGIVFEPGSVTAIAYKEGREVMRETIETAGEAAQLKLTADRTQLKADGYDLSFVTVDAADAEGRFSPLAQNRLQFEVTGAGDLVGVDNGNAAGGDCLKGSTMPLFNGKALAVIRTRRGEPGSITLKVTGEGVAPQTLTLTAK